MNALASKKTLIKKVAIIGGTALGLILAGVVLQKVASGDVEIEIDGE